MVNSKQERKDKTFGLNIHTKPSGPGVMHRRFLYGAKSTKLNLFRSINHYQKAQRKKVFLHYKKRWKHQGKKINLTAIMSGVRFHCQQSSLNEAGNIEI